jgi:hypothetical protein
MAAAGRQLLDLWRQPGRGLFAEPVVEFAFPYRPYREAGGRTGRFADLIAIPGQAAPTPERPLHPGLRPMLERAGMLGWTVLQHQYQAFADTVGPNPQSIVVSSGTGSGKTECFQIPMLNRMLWEESPAGLNRPGVRVLLIYPMNALVNSQFERILELLADNPHGFRVGQFTGKTPDTLGPGAVGSLPGFMRQCLDPERHYDAARHLWTGPCAPDRFTIRDHPPHILITNYAMLEFLLIRSADAGIFARDSLRTVVLDEAHLYGGTLATDIALLLRRTLARFGVGPERVTEFATSATLDNTADAEANLAAFSAGLFDKPAERMKAVLGRRELPDVAAPAAELRNLPPAWEALSADELHELAAMRTIDEEGRLEAAPDRARRAVELLTKWRLCDAETAAGVEGEPRPAAVFLEIVRRNSWLLDLRRSAFDGLAEGSDARPGAPARWSELGWRLFGRNPTEEDSARMAAMLSVLGKARPDDAGRAAAFLPTKLRLFARQEYPLWSDPSAASPERPLGELSDEDRLDDGRLLFPVCVPRRGGVEGRSWMWARGVCLRSPPSARPFISAATVPHQGRGSAAGVGPVRRVLRRPSLERCGQEPNPAPGCRSGARPQCMPTGNRMARRTGRRRPRREVRSGDAPARHRTGRRRPRRTVPRLGRRAGAAADRASGRLPGTARRLERGEQQTGEVGHPRPAPPTRQPHPDHAAVGRTGDPWLWLSDRRHPARHRQRPRRPARGPVAAGARPHNARLAATAPGWRTRSSATPTP